MIVVAIIGILAAVALPAYQTYSDRTRFVEATLETATPKNAIMIAIETKSTPSGSSLNLTDLQPGSFGIPPDIPATSTSHGVAVQDGVITITWQSDGSPLQGITYVLRPISAAPPVQWSIEGTCLSNGYC